MKTKEPILVLKNAQNDINMKIRVYWVALTFQNQCFCEERKCAFFARHNDHHASSVFVVFCKPILAML